MIYDRAGKVLASGYVLYTWDIDYRLAAMEHSGEVKFYSPLEIAAYKADLYRQYCQKQRSIRMNTEKRIEEAVVASNVNAKEMVAGTTIGQQFKMVKGELYHTLKEFTDFVIDNLGNVWDIHAIVTIYRSKEDTIEDGVLQRMTIIVSLAQEFNAIHDCIEELMALYKEEDYEPAVTVQVTDYCTEVN